MYLEAQRRRQSDLTVNGPTFLQVIILVLYIALFAWIAFSFITMVIGFFLYVSGGSAAPAIRSDGERTNISSSHHTRFVYRFVRLDRVFLHNDGHRLLPVCIWRLSGAGNQI